MNRTVKVILLIAVVLIPVGAIITALGIHYGGKTSWSFGFGKHLAVGADLILSPTIYLAAGYNFRRASEMKISDSEGASSHGAGLSIGGGLSLERFKLHIGYAKYHVSANSLLINVSYTL